MSTWETQVRRESEYRMAYAENYNATLARHYVESKSREDCFPEAVAESVAPVASPTPVVATTLVTRRAPQDVRLPCMVYAAVGAVAGFATEAVELAMADTRKAPGVVSVLPYAGGEFAGSICCPDGVAVVTRGYWLARQMLARLMDQCGSPADRTRSQGEASPAGAGLTASSAACTVQFYHGHLRIWIAASDPARVRATAASIAGVAPAEVDLRLLGSEDGPHGLGALVPAISLARQLQSAPVQLIVAYDLGLQGLGAAAADAARVLREAALPNPAVALAA
jgi:hypothetical protein